MIARLTGTYSPTIEGPIILDVNGVGYAVWVPDSWRKKAIADNTYSLRICTRVREDAFDLFGFEKEEDKRLFELLCTVSGVGPKTALTILNFGKQNIENAIATADLSFFTAIPRIGKKNAQKIIIELKNKVGGVTDVDLSGAAADSEREIIDALLSMGFVRNDITRALHDFYDSNKTTEENLKFILKAFGKNKR
jgi:holliday junction DNA helicase RuvA